MNVLIACEFSGIVRDAFRKKGHNAISCDYLQTEGDRWNHLQGDVLNFLKPGNWDLMIAFPSCQYLAVSGARWFKGREQAQAEALGFIRRLLNAPIEKIALENPIGVISTQIRKPDQIIQPYEYGHDAKKATCLWLKNLPPLKPTKYIKPQMVECDYQGIVKIRPRWANQTPCGANKLGPSPDRWKDRSRTYHGIAGAMADQWG